MTRSISLRATYVAIILSFLTISLRIPVCEAQPAPVEKPKIGFLIHDLVSERWKQDMDYFTNRIDALGGEAITKCALGDAQMQIDQGKALIDAGVHLGFPRRIAEQLVLQTIKGSASFYEQAGRHPATLRNQVTSPGGTSAEALYYLEKAGFRTAISRAIWAAYQRSLELGKEKPGHIDPHDDERNEI